MNAGTDSRPNRDARSEYLPAEAEAESINDHLKPAEKAWQTARREAADAIRKTPYDLREQVCLCNDAGLTDFAKLLFCRLTDMAFKDAFKRGDGVLECSKKFLADDFACCPDTVTRATRVLERSGFLWTKTFWNGSFEITRWFIREWADDKREYDQHGGSNFGRRVRRLQRHTLRNPKGKFTLNPESKRQRILALLATNGAANGGQAPDEPAVKAKIRRDHGQKSAVSGLTSQPCQGGILRRDHGQESAVSGLTSQPCQGAAVSPDTADQSALTGCSNTPCQGAGMPGLNTLKSDQPENDQEPLKRSTGLIAAKAGKGSRKASPENVFLLDVGAMLERWEKGSSKAELSGSGAWWRLAFRQDPDLMQRVLADTLCAVKEGRVKRSPGKMASDTWRRWGGRLPTTA